MRIVNFNLGDVFANLINKLDIKNFQNPYLVKFGVYDNIGGFHRDRLIINRVLEKEDLLTSFDIISVGTWPL